MICIGCKQDLPQHHFHLDLRRFGGRKTKCRGCTNAAARARYATDPRIIEAIRRRRKEARS
jgi:hypothetical protein